MLSQHALDAAGRRSLLLGGSSVLAVLLAGVAGLALGRACRRTPAARPPAPPGVQAVVLEARDEPAAFPPNTYLPGQREGEVSGSIDMGTFSPGRELTYVDDARVWWESDNDTNDVEDDHTVHVALEAPLRRLIELVAREGGTLEVHDAYRPEGVHNPRSLHREGRAIDITCDALGLERLAKLCWVAGFDWVYHESPARGGAHVHCSVRRDREDVATAEALRNALRPEGRKGPAVQKR